LPVGTFQTSSDVRLESGMGSKADLTSASESMGSRAGL
jgi:hypothetical protein